MSKRKSAQSYSVDSLDFNSAQAKQTVIEHQYLQEIPAITALPRDTTDNAPIDFRVDKTDHFLDLNETYIYLKFSVIHADDTPLADGEYVTTVNNLGYTMWNSVDVSVNDQKITAENPFYPWMSYVHFLTKCPRRYRESAMRTSLWYSDEAGRLENNDFTLIDAPVNSGARERGLKISGSQNVELYTKIFLDFVNLSQLIPGNTQLGIRLVPANTAMTLIHARGVNYKIRIQQAKLYIGKVKLTKVALAHYTHLLTKGNFRYTARRYAVRTKLMQAGEQNLDWVPFGGIQRPRRVYVWQIDQTAYNSDPTKNIFNFKYLEMDRFQLYCNDISYPASVSWKLTPGDNSRMYLSTVRAINNPDAWDFDLQSYQGGYFIAVVDITKDQSAASSYDSTLPEASVRLIIDYRSALAQPIAVFCMCEYDDELRLDGSGNAKWQA